MNTPLAIDKLNIAEKIELMEKLWTNLSNSPNYAPPEWHGEELARRRDLVKERKETYIDWNEAKKDIRNELP
ncbi:MAG: addiction module protein [Balneolaceae bacterium]